MARPDLLIKRHRAVGVCLFDVTADECRLRVPADRHGSPQAGRLLVVRGPG
jgi:hypothetical protein